MRRRLGAWAASLLWLSGAQAATLPELLQAATGTHPSVAAARQGVDAAHGDLEAARRQRWPSFSATLERGRVTSAEGPTRLLRLDQTLWDFGRNAANIATSERLVDVAGAALTEQQLAIGLQVVEAWRLLQASHGRLRIANEMLRRLESHESMMLRRVAGELSTQVDLDLVRSRILQGRVEATQARTGIKVALTRLQNLTGRTDLGAELATPPLPSTAEVDARYRLMNGRTDWDAAADLQPSVVRAREEFHAGQRRIEAKEAEAYPQLYARVDHAVGGHHDTTAYLGLRYTPGAGFATAAEAGALASRALALEQTVRAARIEARQNLEVDRDDYRDNGLRAQALDAAVLGARRVFESYERQFPAGRKTWIDLMNAVREEAQNAYNLADARAGQAAALNRLLLRVGPDLIDVAVATTPTSDGVAIVPPHTAAAAPAAAPAQADVPAVPAAADAATEADAAAIPATADTAPEAATAADAGDAAPATLAPR